jgi:3-(3-hydroxy-phenyl)propionate hydroxylase
MHMPFAGGMRIDLQCLPGDDAAHLGSTEGAREWIGAVVDPWYGEHIQWTSTYLFRQVVAKTYTDPHRRVLLTGEAAHLFAPFGGRGLNCGVFDAIATCHPALCGVCAARTARPGSRGRCRPASRRPFGLRAHGSPTGPPC